MSTPESITTDDFASLKPEDHALALYIFSQRLSLLKLRCNSDLLTTEARELNLLEQRQLRALCKVHTAALNEQLQMELAELAEA